jgi:hypothetical protein
MTNQPDKPEEIANFERAIERVMHEAETEPTDAEVSSLIGSEFDRLKAQKDDILKRQTIEPPTAGPSAGESASQEPAFLEPITGVQFPSWDQLFHDRPRWIEYARGLKEQVERLTAERGYPYGGHTTTKAGEPVFPVIGSAITSPGLLLYCYVYEARWAGLSTKELCPLWRDLTDTQQAGWEQRAKEIGEQAIAQAVDAASHVCTEIQDIMQTYREQEVSEYGLGTPGGLEHMGDVWSLLRRWDDEIRKAREAASAK